VPRGRRFSEEEKKIGVRCERREHARCRSYWGRVPCRCVCHAGAAAPARPEEAVDDALLAAGSYVALGLTPIPIRREDKRPAIDWKEWQGVRLVDRDWNEVDRYLHRWWGRPDPYNVGVLTGAEIPLDETTTSLLVVVDVDDAEARELVERTCGWPTTPTVRTSKGWHLWFRHRDPHGNRARVADVGLDVRGVGGYVLAPPSVHPSGHVYSWDVGISWRYDDRDGLWPPAPMPGELAYLLWPPRPAVAGDRTLAADASDRYVEAALERELSAVRSAPVGARNETLNRAVFSIWRFVSDGRLDEEVVVREFAFAARACGLEDREAATTIRSARNGRG
jgi:hypothetical protein